ncbi:unnamed protein product [Sphagnum jensenii]|uniref:FHA domain-containing protein n=1 Tax=Sphagnum jensenii TaxID=128206 RepID=A0ABP0W0S1_9BRYO
MPRGRDDRVYERGSDRSGERRRDWDRDRGGHERSRERGGGGRDRDRTREVSREQDGGRDRDRTQDASREQDGGKDRDRKRDVSREQDAAGRGRHNRRDRDSRYQGGASTMSPVHSQHLRSQSPPRKTHRGHESPSQEDSRLPHSSHHDLTKSTAAAAAASAPPPNEEKPSFEYSGKLAAETNKVKGVTLQFTEPPEARKPSIRWRLYVFKDGEALNDPLYIHRQTCYLFGRERRVADIPTDHPSCSKQHAVIQYRLTEKEEPDGMIASKVRPYIMDLGSTNGTFLNGKRIDPQRYYELLETDTIKFGNSSREYVLLHEHSTG